MKLINKILNTVGFSQTALRNELAAVKLDQVSAISEKISGRDTVNRGASRQGNFLRRWVTGLGSPSQDLPDGERKSLLSRSRDAYRNDPMGRAAISRPRIHVIGTGLKLKAQVDAKVLGLTEEEAAELNNLIERYFKIWAKNPRECDKQSKYDFYKLQDIAFVSSMVSGETFGVAEYLKRKNTVFGTKVLLLEPDRIYNPEGKTNNKTLHDGFVFNNDGENTHVWISKYYPNEHPGENSHEKVAVFGEKTGRRKVMHVAAEVDRPGQVRSATFLAPILEPLRKIEDYTSNEIAAAALQSLLAVFLEREKGSIPNEDPDAKPIDGVDENDVEDDEIRLDQAAIWELDEGQKANLVTPTRPHSNYEPFLAAYFKQLGAATGIPVEELMLYYSSSYSAARAAMLQAWEMYITRRSWFISSFCQPVYECWFDDAVASGIIPVKDYSDPIRRAAYCNAVWLGPKRGSIDELKEAKAQKQYLENGTTNLEIEAPKTSGLDYDEVHAGAVRTHKMRKKDGLIPEAIHPDSSQPDPDLDEELDEDELNEMENAA